MPVTIGNIFGPIVVLSGPYFYLYYVILAPKVLKDPPHLKKAKSSPNNEMVTIDISTETEKEEKKITPPTTLSRDESNDIEKGSEKSSSE